MADEKFHQADELGDEENEGEDEEAKKCVTYDFTNNVAIEDAHDEKGQCNMRKTRRRFPERGVEWQSSVIGKRRIRTNAESAEGRRVR